MAGLLYVMMNDYRYAPQIRVEEFDKEGQERIARARVLIVGCGALGSPSAMYLAGAGIGSLVIADFDTIDISNLHRQVFYSEEDVGKSKSAILAEHVRSLNSNVRIERWNKLVTKKMLEKEFAIEPFDAIIDAADNPSTTYMLDDFCQTKGIPLSSAGVTGWKAQVFTSIPGSYTYREIFPEPEENCGLLPCSISGIMGPTAALAASLQTAEIIKMLLGLSGESSRLVMADLLTGNFTEIS